MGRLGKDGSAKSETELNLETMSRYIQKHFTRIPETWEIDCAPNDLRENETSECEYIKRHGDLARRHGESISHQYANAIQLRMQ